MEPVQDTTGPRQEDGPQGDAASTGALLEADHRRLDAILTEVKRQVAGGALAEAALHFRPFREGLDRHIDAEEQVLFPEFDALAGTAGGGPVAVMRMEHEALRASMAEIAAALDAGDREGAITTLAALTARIRAHNGKEERILYPTSDRLAAAAGRLEALVGELRRFL